MTTEAIFESSKTEKINQFLMLIKDPDIQPVLKMCFENILATSELNILKRLKATETVLELNDYPIEDGDAESTIPKQISLLSNKINEIIETITIPILIIPIPINALFKLFFSEFKSLFFLSKSTFWFLI